MTTISKGYIDLPAGQVHFHRQAHPGGDGSVVVYLHQTASSGKMWYQVMQRLHGIGSQYAFDTPGFGGSFDPPHMPSMTEYVDWLFAAIEAAGIRRFHLVGHHTGACIGVEMATRYAEAVRSLSLIGPVPLSAEEREAFRKVYSAPMSPTADGSYLKQTWDYLAGLGAGSSLDLHHRELVDTVRAYYGRYQAYSAVWSQDFVEHFLRATCPMLIMCAPRDVLLDYFERAKGLRPDSRSVMLEGANFEPDQDPEGTARAIGAFVRQIE